MTTEVLGEVFEGDSADMCAEKFQLMLCRHHGGLCENMFAELPMTKMIWDYNENIINKDIC